MVCLILELEFYYTSDIKGKSSKIMLPELTLVTYPNIRNGILYSYHGSIKSDRP